MSRPKSSSATTADTEKKAALRREGNEYARKMVAADWADSTILDVSHELPAFRTSEVKLGRVLGEGAFGIVHEVKAFDLGSDEQSKKENHPDARTFLSTHCFRQDKSKDARYAVKMLTRNVVDDPATYIQATMDMAVETRMLSNLDDHPHICKLRAVSASRDPFTEDYMLVLDRLYDTMASRIAAWAKMHKKCKGKATKWLVDRSGTKMQALRENQLTSALDLCSALDFLHQRKIIYRDLKPENVGFDIRDDVKLFDFGLAKELRRENRADEESGMFKLTGMTGSPRYMAPEVANGEPYNETCDSHSFAILFWEMYSMTPPYEIYTMKTFKERVWNEPFKRPYLQPKWPASIRSMLENSWCPDLAKRWTTGRIMEALHAETSGFYDGGGSSTLQSEAQSTTELSERSSRDDLRSAMMRRKSTFVFRHTPNTRRKSSASEAAMASIVAKNRRASILNQLNATKAHIVEGDSDNDTPDETAGDSWADGESETKNVLFERPSALLPMQ